MKIIPILLILLLTSCGDESSSTPIEDIEPITTSSFGTSIRFHRDSQPADGLTYKQLSDINKAEADAANGRFDEGIYGESKYQ
jgi:hypothetical protein|tara:strand:- start:1172 stop:1420 length:249 start_codon:yes stop_codon:yes gene_type:complete